LQEFLNVVNNLEIKEISKNDKVAANDDNDIIEIENNQRNYEVTKFHLPETSDIANVAAGKLDNDEIAKNVINDQGQDTDTDGADAEFINDKKREDINTPGNANDRNGKFYCNLCNQNELTRYDLYKHILKNHNKYTCHLCDKELAWRTWKNEEALSVHMNSKHTYLHCDECAYKTTRKRHLNEHIQSVHEGVRFNCKYCNHHSARNRDLKRHIQRKHKQDTDSPDESVKDETNL